MTRDEAISLIQLRLGNRADLVAAITTEMKLTQQELEFNGVFHPWFLLTETASLATTVGDERVLLPTDFLAEWEDGALYKYDVGASPVNKELHKDDYEAAKNRYTGTGAPIRYSVVGKYLVMHPTPDAVYALRLKYYAQDTVLTTNIENSWLKYAPEWLISTTAMKIAANHLKDQEAASNFSQQAKAARDTVLVANENRLHVNRVYEMGDP